MNESTSTYSRITNPRVLRAAQVIWLGIVAFHWITFVAIFPYFWRGEAAVGANYVAGQVAPLTMLRIFWVGQVLTGLFALSVGLFIFWQQRDNRAALIFSATLSILMINFFLPVLAVVHVIDMRWSLPAAFIVITTMGSALLAMLTMPTGRLDMPGARYLFVLYLVWESIRFVLNISRMNIMLLTLGVSFLFLATGLLYLIRRYRTRLTQLERQQTKLIILGVAYILFGFYIALIIVPVLALFGVGTSQLVTIRVFGTLILVNGGSIAATVFTALAIFRRGLWDIDVALNRSLVYGSLGIVMTIGFALVALLVKLLVGESNVALIVSVIAAALLFNPVYRGSKRFVDRRLYRLNFELAQLAQAHHHPQIKQPGALSGLQAGDFQILDLIGKGGMGEVYKGYGQNQTVAIKFLPKEFAIDPVLPKRFEREARVLQTLDHPNILRSLEAGISADGRHYIVVEYIDGVELKDYLTEQGGRLTVAQAVPIINQIAAALDYLHSQQLFHRDIKPSNIMLRPDGTLTLMDFGLVTSLSGDTTLTGEAAIGTIMYMAPEQIQHASQIDHRADIYALGVVIYQLLTGVVPFDGQLAQVLFAHLNQPPPNPRLRVPDLPEGITAVTTRALAKTPTDRYASAGDLARALAATIT